jgi:hypothetical protein
MANLIKVEYSDAFREGHEKIQKLSEDMSNLYQHVVAPSFRSLAD